VGYAATPAEQHGRRSGPSIHLGHGHHNKCVAIAFFFKKEKET
jgi:hypothetical protein